MQENLESITLASEIVGKVLVLLERDSKRSMLRVGFLRLSNRLQYLHHTRQPDSTAL